MAALTIVASIKSRPDKVDLVKAELEKLIDITRAEEGCLQYDLHQDNENPAHCFFYENWKSRELWQVHMGAWHLQDYMAVTEGAVEEFTVDEMTKAATLAQTRGSRTGPATQGATGFSCAPAACPEDCRHELALWTRCMCHDPAQRHGGDGP